MRFIAIVLLFFLPFTLDAQEKGKHKRRILKEQKLKAAKEHASQLKSGVLLVRLKAHQKKIDAWTKAGKEKEAQQLMAERDEVNRAIVHSLRQHYKFSEFYFFYDYNSKKVVAGNFDGVLLNDSLLPDASIVVDERSYYVMDAGKINYKNMGTDQIGFCILDKELQQLAPPFPYEVAKKEGFIFRRTYRELAILMNERLNDFYKQ